MHHIKNNGALDPITLAEFEDAINDGADSDPNNTQGEIGYGKLNALSVFHCGPNGDSAQCPI